MTSLSDQIQRHLWRTRASDIQFRSSVGTQSKGKDCCLSHPTSLIRFVSDLHTHQALVLPDPIVRLCHTMRHLLGHHLRLSVILPYMVLRSLLEIVPDPVPVHSRGTRSSVRDSPLRHHPFQILHMIMQTFIAPIVDALGRCFSHIRVTSWSKRYTEEDDDSRNDEKFDEVHLA